MRPSASASISFSVSAVSGQVRATKSACGSSALRSDIACTASACPAPARGSRRMPITRMSNALASCASRPPICPRPTISSVLPPSSSSRCVRSPIIPRQTRLAWLSRASGSRRASASISAMSVLGDRAGIDAAGAREPHAVLLERLARELVGAGTDRLDEAQPLRARQEIVAPEPRDHQHVGLADPLLERGAVAHLEALDAGRERQEALAQPIGNMRKTDRQLVLGR